MAHLTLALACRKAAQSGARTCKLSFGRIALESLRRLCTDSPAWSFRPARSPRADGSIGVIRNVVGRPVFPVFS
jgi:hypothetical protein